MLDNNIKKIVFSSSCTVYGTPEFLPVTEECKIAPVSPYGNTKAMFEQIMSDFSKAYDFKYCALRYFNASGASLNGEIGEDHSPETHIIPSILLNAVKLSNPNLTQLRELSLKLYGNDYSTPDGTCIRDYVHVLDIASAHSAALNYLFNDNESTAINITNSNSFSIMELIEKCEEITGVEIPFELAARRPGDPDKLIGNADKAKKNLKWEPRCSDIETIISTAWNWHKNHPFGFNDIK
jgi:UDP-glucose 4-epimerase